MHSHRELLAWQRAHDVAIGVQRYRNRHWCVAYSSSLNQLSRASLSVQLNIAEGFASGRTPRCKYLAQVAYGSAVETTDMLEFLIETGAPGAAELRSLAAKSRETQALTLLFFRNTG